jgi:hypothetical protein
MLLADDTATKLPGHLIIVKQCWRASMGQTYEHFLQRECWNPVGRCPARPVQAACVRVAMETILLLLLVSAEKWFFSLSFHQLDHLCIERGASRNMGDLDAEIVSQTQVMLGKVIKKPALTDKLLRRPPFKFLHDIIVHVSPVSHLSNVLLLLIQRCVSIVADRK